MKDYFPNKINRLLFVMETHFGYCEVRTEYVHNALKNVMPEGASCMSTSYCVDLTVGVNLDSSTQNIIVILKLRSL
jgi:hypothetical protein